MTHIFDRFCNEFVDENALPNRIDLGRYAIYSEKGEYQELTNQNFRVRDGQFIVSELLDEVYKDRHNVLASIASDVETGKFRAVPLLQGIKDGFEIGEFACHLKECMPHLKAIFQSPYSKLFRNVEKVPVARAKRIASRSYQYLAAHTEDWLNKSLVSFHPSRILTEEVISDEDVYENQLLVAFVTRATRYIERRLHHAKDVAEFLSDYSKLVENLSHNGGWHRRVERELELAGKVYGEFDCNYNDSRKNDVETVKRTYHQLKNLREDLIKLRQYDLYSHIDQRKLSTIDYRDTNVLVNHQHYRYLKELWFLLHLEGYEAKKNANSDTRDVLNDLRSYGLSIVNYALCDSRYLGFTPDGTDSHWSAVNDTDYVEVNVDVNGVILLSCNKRRLRFVITGSVPQDAELTLPSDTYALAYECSDVEPDFINDHIIRISLKDVHCVETVACVIRSVLLKCYLDRTIFLSIAYPPALRPYHHLVEEFVPFMEIDSSGGPCYFKQYPKDIDLNKMQEAFVSARDFKREKHDTQIRLRNDLDDFCNNLSNAVESLKKHFRCFDNSCMLPIGEWMIENLRYITCPCGYVLDCKNPTKITFEKVNEKNCTHDEMGMDYLELNYTDA